MATELLVFCLDTNQYAIPATLVREVVRAVTVAPLANATADVMGVINVRGRISLVLDARRLLHHSERPMSHTDHLIINEVDGRLLTLRVDQAVDLITVADSVIEPAGIHLKSIVAPQFAKTHEGILQILDLQRCVAQLESGWPSEKDLEASWEATP